MQEVFEYIIEYLLEDKELASQVVYSSNETEWGNHRLVIVPSEFFESEDYGKVSSQPELPLQEMFGVPILFGRNEVVARGNTQIVYADFIASAFYLMSRYEDWVNDGVQDVHDRHGRFEGKQSLMYRAGMMNRPIVQEYGSVLRMLLGVERGNDNGMSVCLTHDVDTIAHYRTLRGFLGGLKRVSLRQSDETFVDVVKPLSDLENDAAYTFPFFMEQDNRVQDAQKIYFIKAGEGKGCDYPQYNLYGKDFRELKELIKKKGDAEFGLHASYVACENRGLALLELKELENALFAAVHRNRYHYLRTISIADFRELIEVGITDDYSMGWADVVGFRLGTCKPVRWIDPERKELTSLILHPLAVMDSTLSRQEYMNLGEIDAWDCVKNIVDKVEEYSGELVLLWHNTSIGDGGYHASLYTRIIEYLCQLKER